MKWIFLGLTLLAPSQQSGPTSEASVGCTEARFSDAAEHRNRDRFASFLHPDARFVTGVVSRGPEQILQSWAGYFADDGPSIRWRPETVELSEAGDLALSRGPFRIVTTEPSGRRNEQWGTFISVWRLGDDGNWRVQFDTGADLGLEPSDAQRELLESSSPCDDGR